jgi:hypothetical protein
MSNDLTAIEKCEWLNRLGRQGGAAIRLANDLQTHLREMAECKVNSLVIRQAAHVAQGFPAAAALTAAHSDITAMLKQEITRCEQLYREDRTETTVPERAVMNNVRFSCDFYAQFDFHTAT